MSSVQLRPELLRAREFLAKGRARARSQHDNGTPGIQVCTHLTDIYDTVVLDVFEQAVDTWAGDFDTRSTVVLVPHGGYGRRDLAPYSDIDLMLLCDKSVESRIQPLAEQLLKDLSDLATDIGFSVRSPKVACRLSAKDPIIFSSLVEARYLVGGVRLYSEFVERFRRLARRRTKSLITQLEQSRREERLRFGETVYLLEPNIKRSRGGLRDLHLARWVGYARYGEADPDVLVRRGVLAKRDGRSLREACQFLLRVRNAMHFHASSARDVLNRSEQLRLAEHFNYEGDEAVLPVERFMQDYFRHTSEVRNVLAHLLATAKRRISLASFAVPLLSHQIERDFRVGPTQISATRTSLPKICGDLGQVLRLMDLANLYNKRIDHGTWQAIRDAMTARTDITVTDEAVARFLSLLSQPARLGPLLRSLHELRVLEKLVPGFDHTRCLLQFNEYHKYTVDEHSIRAVERATEFALRPGPLGDAYRRIRDKRTLHLALLIHDIGKGYAKDHSEVGARLAEVVTDKLKLSTREAERVRFLVQRHLMLSHLAFRRDISDEAVVLSGAVEIGSPTTLRMLFVLTCADFAAVGPKVLNDWKVDVLTGLYQRMLAHLGGGASETERQDRFQRLTDELKEAVERTENPEWFGRQVSALPSAYLHGATAGQLIADLERLRLLTPSKAAAWSRYLPERQVVEYSVGAHESITPGIFHKLAGAMISQGLKVLAAEIHGLSDGLVLDRFLVEDPDFAGEPSDARYRQVASRLEDALENPSDARPSFRETWQASKTAKSISLTQLVTSVRLDNSFSDRYTIIDVFAHDRVGLLYTVAQTIFELGFSVHFAKIGTYLDQVVDVFYVTDQLGNKIAEYDDDRTRIKNRLIAAIEDMAKGQ